MHVRSSRSYHHQSNNNFAGRSFYVKNRYWRCENNNNDNSDAEVVGYFSMDRKRNYLANASQLLYYTPPLKVHVHLDLNQGIETVCKTPPSVNDERIGNLLKWIKQNYTKIQASPETKRWLQPNFVCLRGLLTMLFCTPYLLKNSWIICAAKWKGTIYLCRYETLEEKHYNANIPESSVKYETWGYKFEQYILSSSPNVLPETHKPVEEGAQFYCTFKCQIGKHSVFYSAEMDGIMSKTKLKDPLPLKKLEFVELKTSKIIRTDAEEKSFRRFKLLRWWAQSYLVDVKKILCGFRDEQGVVQHLKTYKLPDIVELSKNYWNPGVCINFCEAFLTHISQNVFEDCDKMIYKFEKLEGNNIVTTEMRPTVEYNFMEPLYRGTIPRKTNTT